jgi:type I restriction enzyme M protein
MPHTSSQTFLRELDKKLWTAADKLRSNLDAAVYKHAVLGLIFLKYVSDSFAQRQAEIAVGVPPSGSASLTGLAGRQIEAMLRDPDSEYFLNPKDYGSAFSDEYSEAIRAELEERDYYIEKNVFWVPALARWKTLQDSAKLPAGTEIAVGVPPSQIGTQTGLAGRQITVKNGKTTTYKITSTGKLIDDALEAVEKENPKLKNVPVASVYDRRTLKCRVAGRHPNDSRPIRRRTKPRRTSDGRRPTLQLQIDQANLAGLIDLIATIPFQHADLHAKDILGHVYEKGAQASRLFLPEQTAKMAIPPSYFTPKSIVSLIVEMIEPYQGRVYDPAMGSGGFFVRNTRPSGVRFAKRCRASARGVVQSERFIEEHGGTIGDIMVFGQDQWAWGAHLRRAPRARRVRLRRKQPNQSNPTTWRLAAMNMAIRGIDFDFGKEPADTFTRDQHPYLRADFCSVNVR